MAGRATYVIDTYEVPREHEVSVCRFALNLIAPEADSFEIDIPLSNPDALPSEVVHAARKLSTHSSNRRGENEEYRRTEEISARAPEDWDAFVKFASFAYDAMVWSKEHGVLAALADEGTSLVFRLLPDQASELEQFADPARVIPRKRWKENRRSLSKERRKTP